MSYDAWMEIDTGGPKPHPIVTAENCTYNLSPMFAEALGQHITRLDGLTGREAFPLLAAAVQKMKAAPDYYRQWNPSNGWGDYEGGLEFLCRLARMAEDHPKAVFRIT